MSGKEVREVSDENQYKPSEVSHPREAFFDILLENERARTILALMSEDERSYLLNILIDAGGPLARFTKYSAKLLWIITGAPEDFWLARDKNYRDWLEKQSEGEGT